MKILIAEDDRLTREGLVEVLRDEGYDVVSAPDGGARVSSRAAGFRLPRHHDARSERLRSLPTDSGGGSGHPDHLYQCKVGRD